MADVKFDDFSIKVMSAIEKLAPNVLEEVAGELESQIKLNTAVDTGQTKNSWTHHVIQVGDEHVAIIGSPMANAIYEEFGTGQYALNGNGRKGGWTYVDESGRGHHTYGKRPRRPAYNAYISLKNRLIRHMQEVFKGGL